MHINHFRYYIFSLVGILLNVANANEKPNFLIIAIDDLRPALNCYGNSIVSSPNIDALAASGVRFDRAYCQQAVCMPSRASVTTGTFPVTNGIKGSQGLNQALQRKILTSMLTFPQYLKENGYNTLSIGKTFHTYSASDADAWTEERTPTGSPYQFKENLKKNVEFAAKREAGVPAYKLKRGPITEMADVPEDGYKDYGVASGAIELLREYGKSDKPFLLCTGFYKPHLPLTAPKRYWDLYERDSLTVPSRNHPTGVSPHSLVESWFEVRRYSDIPRKGELSDTKSKELIHAYYACVSFIDAQIGRVMEELEKQGLKENTYVILWSDHGFKLGEYGDWSKYTNMEYDAQVPFIISGPGVARESANQSLVELVDIYPTLCDLASLPIPDFVEGQSLEKLLYRPNESTSREGAFTFFDRSKNISGISVRSNRYRYTQWHDESDGTLLANELYDLSEGPLAKQNLVGNPKFNQVVNKHAQLIYKDKRFDSVIRKHNMRSGTN